MRIPRTWIPPLAKLVADTLLREELIVPDVDPGVLTGELEALIHEELSVEDRLNEEVRQILTRHEADIARGRLDYRKLFDMTKQKLVRERGIVL
jgi:hypothetical protein